MSVHHAHYNSETMKRKLAPNWYKDPGCQNQPLFNISPENVITDVKSDGSTKAGPYFRGH